MVSAQVNSKVKGLRFQTDVHLRHHRHHHSWSPSQFHSQPFAASALDRLSSKDHVLNDATNEICDLHACIDAHFDGVADARRDPPDINEKRELNVVTQYL